MAKFLDLPLEGGNRFLKIQKMSHESLSILVAAKYALRRGTASPRHRVIGRSLVALIRLRKRVRRRDQAGKPVGAGLCVNLGGRYIRMAEKRL